MASAFGLPQIASLYDPNVAVDQQALDRQMALAQALRLASMAPVDTSNRQIGGVAYRVSPWEGMAKILQSYKANTMEQGNDQARLALSQKYAAALRGGLDAPAQSSNGGLPAGVTPEAMTAGGFPQPAPGSASAAPQSAPPGGGFTLQNLTRAGIIEQLGGAGMGAAYAKDFETPEAIRTLRAKGQDPHQVGNLETAKLDRDVRQPVRLGNGAAWDPRNGYQGLPSQIPGSINIPNPSVPGGWVTAPIPGGSQALETQSAAEAGGKAQFTPFSGFDVSGRPTRVTSLASALRGGAPSQPGVAKLEVTEPSKQAASSGTYAAPPLGTESAQKGLDTSWENLKSQSREANNTKSYLDNIVTAAEKGAISGPQADRREMIAGILQLAGIKESVNTNATTQTQLLDKYHNQIVTRLGQNGLGTDAARALLDSAYPGKAMNLEAIREASSNLKGAMDMTQAKARFLQDSAIKRDTTSYQQRELQFDQAADPRIWQGLSMKDAAKRKSFMEEVYRQDPSIEARILKLKELGAL